MALCIKSITSRSTWASLFLKPVRFNFTKNGAAGNLCRTSLQRASCKYSLSYGTKFSNIRTSTSIDSLRFLSTKGNVSENEKPKKLTIMQRFKQMYKDYVYVLVPVHLVTSLMWAGGFYYLVKSGVDVIHFIEVIGVPEKFIKPMRDSTAGYYALTYALYKIASPIRYTVTLGGTKLIINKLIALELVKPANTSANVKVMMSEKRLDMQNAYKETKQELLQRRDQIKERKMHVMQDFQRYKKEMADIKSNDKVKKK